MFSARKINQSLYAHMPKGPSPRTQARLTAMAQAKMWKANGVMSLDLGLIGALREIHIIGGPYDKHPGLHNAEGICVRAERPRPNTVHVKIPDFGIPESDDEVRTALKVALVAAIQGRPVYVGCMGGWGRTGLFLALLAKVAGIEDPVAYVRDTYTPKAVETQEQQEYVKDFDVEPTRKWLMLFAWKHRIVSFFRK